MDATMSRWIKSIELNLPAPDYAPQDVCYEYDKGCDPGRCVFQFYLASAHLI
jgi:hypothetical protein